MFVAFQKGQCKEMRGGQEGLMMGREESFVICQPSNPFPSPIEGLFFFFLLYMNRWGAIQDVIASAVEEKAANNKKKGVRRHTYSNL